MVRFFSLAPLALLFALALDLAQPAFSQAANWLGVVSKIESTLRQMLDAYKENDLDTAKDLHTESYFGIFEDSGMEVAIRKNISAKRAGEIEALFGEVRKLMISGAGALEVEKAANSLLDALKKDSKQLPGGK